MRDQSDEPRAPPHPRRSLKRARAAAQIADFLRKLGRTARRGLDPNDRCYDRDLAGRVKRMPPDRLDEMMREDED